MRLSLSTSLALILAAPVAAQPPKDARRAPWAFAHDLRVRKGGSSEVNPDTPLIGVEVYRDLEGRALMAVTSAGGLAVTPAPEKVTGSRVRWLFAHDLKSERGGKSAQLGVEAVKEAATGRVLYASQAGSIAFGDDPAKLAPEGDAPLHHALTLRVRKATETAFGPGSKRITIDCFRDGKTGAMVYATEAGGIAVLSNPAQTVAATPEVQAPVALYGLAVRVRKPTSGTPATGPATEVLGVEVYSDPNTGGLLYVSETGAIAAAPAPAEPTGGQGAVWQRGYAIQARPGGTADFAAAKPISVEVYADPNSDHTLYVTDAGSIAVLPKK